MDAAIVDLRLPGDDGLAFLRRAARVSQVPCIVLTSYASGSNTIEAMRLGAFDHLTKPVARAALVETLERALRQEADTPDTVRIIGRAEARGTVRADAIVHAGSGRTVYDQPPPVGPDRILPPHLRAQRLQLLQVEGRVDTVLTGPRGEANGVILSDGSIVRFPPESLRLSVQTGAPFAASGLGTRNAFGTSLEAVSMGTALSALQPLYDRAP